MQVPCRHIIGRRFAAHIAVPVVRCFDRLARLPITSANSPSSSTRWDADGIFTIPPGASSDDGGLKKSGGSAGI